MVKRIFAGLLLGTLVIAAGQAGEQQPDVRKTLSDPNPQVRLEAALGLAGQQDEEAIGVLIDLLAELPPAQSKRAEQVLQQLAEDWAPNPGLTGSDEVSRRIRRDAWAAWWRNTDGPALLAAFQKRTLSAEQTEKVAALIATLTDTNFAKRERATADLVALGQPVVPLLRQAMQGADLEQTYRLEKCLKLIAKGENQDTLPPPAARLLALRRPPEATATLLAFVPFTDDEVMKWEVAKALHSMAAKSGKIDPALTTSLADASPLRRAVAAEVLAVAGAEHRAAVRKLLTDPDSAVRLRTAAALVCRGDKEAVATLIDLLAELPRDRVWQADEMLHRLAGTQAPPGEPGEAAAARNAYRDVWRGWWKEQGAAAKLTPMDLPPPHLGFTVIAAVADMNRASSRVLEVDQRGKVRWQFDVNYPVDVRIVGSNRVLISEHGGFRITERDFSGSIVWQKSELPGPPYNVQRLPSGNTFVTLEKNLMEFDGAGKTVLDLKVLDNVVAAGKLPDGQIVCLTRDRQCIRLDRAGKTVKAFFSGHQGNEGCVLDLTSQGRILVSSGMLSTVKEFDLEGKTLWQVASGGMATAVRNGHVIVAGYYTGSVTELNRAGNTVWQYQTPGYNPFVARQR
jgi:HEAT repeat protein